LYITVGKLTDTHGTSMYIFNKEKDDLIPVIVTKKKITPLKPEEKKHPAFGYVEKND